MRQKRLRFKILSLLAFFAVFACLFFQFFQIVEAATLLRLSDTIVKSQPSAATKHVLRFTATAAVPVSGKIVVTPANGLFNIPNSLDFSDIGLAVNGVSKALGALPGSGSGSAIGAQISGGAFGSIIFTLNDSDQIDAGSAIIISIGVGSRQIYNPASAGAYRINVKTKNASGAIFDEADAMIAIMDPVHVTAAKTATPSATPSASASPSAVPAGGGASAPVQAPFAPFFETRLNAGENAAFISGFAYPNRDVVLLKDAQIVATTTALADSSFILRYVVPVAGNYIFSIHSDDANGFRSLLISIPLTVSASTSVRVDGVFIPPTLAVNLPEVKKGDTVSFFGQSKNNAYVSFLIDGSREIAYAVQSDRDGMFRYDFNTSGLDFGQHTAQAKLTFSGRSSTYGQLVGFSIGEDRLEIKPSGIQAKRPPPSEKADVSDDGKVDITDFSIMAYWYKRPLTKEAALKVDLNGDGKVTLVDFSILAYYWTG